MQICFQFCHFNCDSHLPSVHETKCIHSTTLEIGMLCAELTGSTCHEMSLPCRRGEYFYLSPYINVLNSCIWGFISTAGMRCYNVIYIWQGAKFLVSCFSEIVARDSLAQNGYNLKLSRQRTGGGYLPGPYIPDLDWMKYTSGNQTVNQLIQIDATKGLWRCADSTVVSDTTVTEMWPLIIVTVSLPELLLELMQHTYFLSTSGLF